MKEMYVKPMVEKIMFDNTSVISTSGGGTVAAMAGDACDIIINNSGYTQKKKSSACECLINEHNLNQCPV